MNFETLVGNISHVQDMLQAQAAHAVNLSLTARNWLVGCYIVEFEQHGEDRAGYGENLINRLSKSLNRKGMEPRRLREYRHFYHTYPILANEVFAFVGTGSALLPNKMEAEKWRLPSAIFQNAEKQDTAIWQVSTAKSEEWSTPPEKLFNKLSYSTLLYLSNIDEPLRRAFYEQEAIRGCWTVKELDRQVSSLYFERMGLSKDKMGMRRLADKQTVAMTPSDVIRDPLTLEFLGLQQQDIVTETQLETSILDHMQQFLLEMGRGFCFEARQKRILVDQDYYKADLVFYHRILKCHVVVDLKIDRFRHEYASQLNLYLNYFKHEVMQPDDNPPIGLLLCTDYGETTVRYATEGLSQNLFVTKYRLQLPTEDEIRDYLMGQLPKESPASYQADAST